MANIDNPRGLWPIRHLSGGEIRTTRYKVTASATIYEGDILKIVAGGTVEVAAAGDATIVIGVAANYVVAAASGSYYVEVYDDPNIIFGIQTTTGQTPAATDVGGTADSITYAAGSSTTHVSILELAAISTGAAQLKVVGLIDEPNNTWAEHADVEVLFNEHFYHGSRANGL